MFCRRITCASRSRVGRPKKKHRFMHLVQQTMQKQNRNRSSCRSTRHSSPSQPLGGQVLFFLLALLSHRRWDISGGSLVSLWWKRSPSGDLLISGTERIPLRLAPFMCRDARLLGRSCDGAAFGGRLALCIAVRHTDSRGTHRLVHPNQRQPWLPRNIQTDKLFSGPCVLGVLVLV